MADKELTNEAKLAIQGYMLKFVIPSSVGLAIISGILGFAATGLAKIEATSQASANLIDAVKATEAAKLSAEAAKLTATTAASDAKSLLTKVEAALQQAEDAKKKAQEAGTVAVTAKDQIDRVRNKEYAALAVSLAETP